MTTEIPNPYDPLEVCVSIVSWGLDFEPSLFS